MTARATIAAPEPGIYRSMPAEHYHALDCASASRLKALRRSPAHMKSYIENPPADTAATVLGRAIHAAILEPDVFSTLFTVAGQCDATVKASGNRCANDGVSFHPQLGWLCGVHRKGVPGAFDDSRTVLSSADHAMCLAVRDSVRTHPAAGALLRSIADVELTLIWDDAETGVRVKGRLDAYAPTFARGTIIDVKSTVSASPQDFPRAIFTHGYTIQAGLYMEGAAAVGLDAEHFVFIAVERERPYAVAPYRLDDQALLYGHRQANALLRRYARCVRENHFPGYTDQIEDVTLPAYAWDQIDESIESILALEHANA